MDLELDIDRLIGLSACPSTLPAPMQPPSRGGRIARLPIGFSFPTCFLPSFLVTDMSPDCSGHSLLSQSFDVSRIYKQLSIPSDMKEGEYPVLQIHAGGKYRSGEPPVAKMMGSFPRRGSRPSSVVPETGLARD